MFSRSRRQPRQPARPKRATRKSGSPQNDTTDKSKPVVNIYLNKNAVSTKILTQHLAENIDALNKILLINFIYITPNNSKLVMEKGIKSTPTLIYGKRKFEGIKKIMGILTPPERGKETYGYGATSPEDMLHKWQSMIINTREEEEFEDDGDPHVRTEQLRTKMAAFQKRRPKMEGVARKQKIRGGRRVKGKNNQREYGDYMERDGDFQFMKDAGLFDRENTPIEGYTETQDGELMLEEYYLNEAMKDGKKVSREKVYPRRG